MKQNNFNRTRKIFFTFLFLFFFSFPFVSAPFGYDNPTLPSLRQELFDGKPSSFYMPNNKSVFGNFSFDGLCIDGGVEIRNGTICAQTLEVFNITNLNVTRQDLTITDILRVLGNAIFDQNVTADFFFGDGSQLTGISGIFNSTAWSRSGTNVFLANIGDKVGIGTSTPGELLDVDGNATVNRLILDRGIQSPYIEVPTGKDMGFFTVGSQKMIIEEGGNVGIGITNPVERLEVGGNLFIDTSFGNLTIKGINVDSILLNASHNLILSGEEIELEDSTGEIMRIIGGNVGINTTTPQNLFNVLGDTNITGILYSGGINLEDDITLGLGTGDDASLRFDGTRSIYDTKGKTSGLLISHDVADTSTLPAQAFQTALTIAFSNTGFFGPQMSLIGRPISNVLINFGDTNDEDAGSIEFINAVGNDVMNLRILTRDIISFTTSTLSLNPTTEIRHFINGVRQLTITDDKLNFDVVDYAFFYNSGVNSFGFINDNAGQDANWNFHSNDGDNTDDTFVNVFGAGSGATFSSIKIGYDTALDSNKITTQSGGGFVTKGLDIGTDTDNQIKMDIGDKLAFFNATPITKPSSTNDIKNSLVELGLITDGGATPLDLDDGKLTAGAGFFTDNLNVSGTLNVSENATFQSDVIIDGTLFGGSPLKISGGLNVSGNITFDTNALFIDSSNNRIGINTTTPQNLLNVLGDVNITGDLFSPTIYYVSSQGLVLAMNFNNGSVTGNTVLDSSRENNHGTNNGATHNATDGFDNLGSGAFDFDGVDNFIEIPDSNSLDITDAITVSAWINADTFGSFERIVDKNFNQWTFILTNTNPFTGLEFWINGAVRATTSTGELTADTWHFVVATYDKDLGGTEEVKIYIDGISKATGDFSTAIGTNSDSVDIGRDTLGGTYFDGTIDEVSLWNRALSSDEIKRLYLQRAEFYDSYVSQKDVYVDSSGNIGINTTTPQNTLNVLGDLNVTGTSYLGNLVISADNISVNNVLSVGGNGILFWDNVDLQTNNFTIDTSTFFVDSNNNRVGIGTINPAEALDLSGGNLITTAKITAGTFVANTVLQIASVMEHIGDVDTEIVFTDDQIVLTAGNIPFISIIQAAQNILVLNENSFDVDFRIESDGDTHAFFLRGSDGNVGIGTATPTQTLTVSGDLNVTGTSYLGDLIISADNITVNNLLNNSLTGLRIWSNLYINNKLGIGTTSPSDLLEVVGSGDIKLVVNSSNAANAALRLVDGTEGQWTLQTIGGDLRIYDEKAGGAGEIMRFQNTTGNVGIGTTTPNAELTISDGTNEVDFDVVNSGDLKIQPIASGKDIVFVSPSDIEIMRLDSSQLELEIGAAGTSINVGIGTTEPNATLEIINGTIQGGFMVSSSSAGAGDLFIVDEAGNVGIGTSTPQTNLHTVGTSGASGGLATDGIMTISTSTSGTDSLQFGVVTNDYAWIQSVDPGNVFRDLILQPSSNSVGIGTTNPAIDLAIGDGDTGFDQSADGVLDYYSNNVKVAGVSGGKFRIYQVANSAAENPACRESSGEITRGSSGCSTSSIRYKQNIQPLNYGLKEIMQLKPFTYEYKTDPTRTRFGMVAEEVALIFPEIIGYEPDNPTLIQTYDKRDVQAVLIKAIQELKSENDLMKLSLCNLGETQWC